MKVFPFRQAPPTPELVVADAGNGGNSHELLKAVNADPPPDPLALLESASQLVGQGLIDAARALRAHASRSELDRQRIESMASVGHRELTDRMSQLEAQVETVQTGVDALRSEVVRANARLTQSAGHLEALNQNVDQIRLMIEKLHRKTEEQTADFIERQVSDPLYAEFTRFHGLLRSLAGNGTENWRDEVNALADGVAQFLDCAGLNPIDPQPGDPFDPHLHQPLRNRPTADAAQQGKVVRTLRLGVRRNARLIQPARVEVFIFRADSAEQDSTKKEATMP